MFWNWLRGLLVAGLWGVTARADGESFHNDPIATYDQRQVAGFTVLVSPRLREHPAAAEASRLELDGQLKRIAEVVPPQPLAELRKVRIWLEWAETAGLGEFHWDATTLKRQRRNPQKARSLEIDNARHLVEWAPIQPWAVMHELAHGYHCLVLGAGDPRVTQAYDQAVKSGKYALVDRTQGPPRMPAYGLVNSKEYFAELTEAYFGRNDFEPFDREQLKAFDPVGFQLMVDVWGPPVARPAESKKVALRGQN